MSGRPLEEADGLGLDPVEAAPEGGGGTGLYGKLACKGDFITRRLPRDLVKVLDGWLQDSLAGARESLGQAWLELYLTAPLWRFAFAPGACGEEAVLGVWMPSIDRVGRHYPLVLAAPFGREANPCALFSVAGEWMSSLENLALATLDEQCDFEAIDGALSALALPRTTQTWSGVVGDGMATPGPWRMEPPPDAPFDLVHANILHQALGFAHGAYSLWWTQGSDRVAPSLSVVPGLPNQMQFLAMIDGRWRQHGWADTGLVDPLAEQEAASFSLDDLV